MSLQQFFSRRRSSSLVLALLAVELLDELVFGARSAAWPMMRSDLRLTYEQIGILLAVPTVVGNVIEPAIGLLGDTWRRRGLLLGGGVVFTLCVVATAFAPGWIVLLVVFAALSPASGAFVGLSQATLMDLAPERHEQNMARWVVAGSLGVVGGTGLVGVAARTGGSWRHVFVVVAAIAAVIVVVVARAGAGRSVQPIERSGSIADLRARAREAVRSLTRAEVRRWLILLECADLLLDVFAGFLALYLVDVGRVSPTQAAVGVSLFTAVGLGGDALLVPLLERVDGLRYLRISVALTLVAYPAFLLVPSITGKFALIAALGLLNSGWYSIPKARLYAALPGRSATVLTLTNTFGLGSALVPLAVGAIAERIGLGATMWLLLIGPLALIVGLPRATPGAGDEKKEPGTRPAA